MSKITDYHLDELMAAMLRIETSTVMSKITDTCRVYVPIQAGAVETSTVMSKITDWSRTARIRQPLSRRRNLYGDEQDHRHPPGRLRAADSQPRNHQKIEAMTTVASESKSLR